MRLLSQQKHNYIYIFFLSLLAVSLPLSIFLMSVAQFGLIINWVLQGLFFDERKESIWFKFKIFLTNKTALAFTLIFLLHIIGLLYTSLTHDTLHYALKDLRIKLPLLLLPLIISTTAPVSKKELKTILLLFVCAVCIATFISTYYYLNNVVSNIRDISRFISHIRFSLMIVMAIAILFYHAFNCNLKHRTEQITYIILIFWLAFFLFLFESITGLSVLIILLVFSVFKFLFSKKPLLIKLSAVLLVAILCVTSYFYFKSIIGDYFHKNIVDFNTLDTHTVLGNPYKHDTTSLESENGNLIWIYISEEELAEEWGKRSTFSFSGYDKKNQYLQFTLIRFLTSKGLRKDAEGLKKLSDFEIKAIEKGIPSVCDLEKMTIKKRVHQILKEYEYYTKDGDANGLSVMQRLEFVKTALGIIKQNFIFGVGTGDVNIAFKKEYERTNSKLEDKNRWRAHNQYLSIFVAFGLFGFIVFLFALFYPPLKNKGFSDNRYLAFFIIIIISMLTEDTLETQAGVTFFAFFNTLFIFGTKNNNCKEITQN